MSIVFLFFASLSIHISSDDAHQIADKIWKNECNQTLSGLTSWKKGENFASLGIGHFIWFPKNANEPFEETFPKLLIFLQDHKVDLPAWLIQEKHCPWNSRKEFYQDIESEKMKSLRTLLFSTKNLQAEFIANRLENTFQKIIKTSQNPKKVRRILDSLTKSPDGLYALIDYVNFKGSGLSSKERYNNRGWGLLQVLENMPETNSDPLVNFVISARALLIQRVENSPPERNEKQWLSGWLNRLNTYLNNKK